ncbi:MAG: hypothetical protein M3400_12195, partial [Actinomycetota bacterium]|nr:hypothetical protein [Actinomycetota bacterium]
QDAGGGLDTARVESEADLGGTAQPLDVGGNQGYVVLGMRGETAVGQGAVAVNGLIVSVTLTSAMGAEDDASLVSDLLELTLNTL